MAWRGRARTAAGEGHDEGPFFGMTLVPWTPARGSKTGKPRRRAAPEPPRVANPLALLSLPWDHSSSYRKGAAKAPRTLRTATEARLYNPYTEGGLDLREAFTLVDLGSVGGEFRRLEDYERFVAAVEQRTASWNGGGPSLFLGGDHACTYATLRALARHPAHAGTRWGLLYLDAHPDLYVNYAGTSASHACPARRLIDDGVLQGPHVVQAGIRASTPSQERYAEAAGVRTVTAAEFRRAGGAKVAESAVRELLGQVDAVYLSLDMDVLDPSLAPGVGNPEPGGLDMRDLVEFVNALAPLPVRAVDVMEYNPAHDPLRITGYAAAKFLKEAFGLLARARTPS